MLFIYLLYHNYMQEINTDWEKHKQTKKSTFEIENTVLKDLK